MKLTIIRPFRDIDCFAKEYLVGNVEEFEAERAARLIALGLATPTQEESEDAEEHTEENTDSSVGDLFQGENEEEGADTQTAEGKKARKSSKKD